MDNKVTIEGLRELLNENQPRWLQTNTIGPATINTWKVVEHLLDIVEAQEQRIKALEDAQHGDGK